jgi:hypothetical protein
MEEIALDEFDDIGGAGDDKVKARSATMLPYLFDRPDTLADGGILFKPYIDKRSFSVFRKEDSFPKRIL